MKEKLKSSLCSLRKAVMVTLVLLLICGLGYPLLMTGLSQIFFPHQANGSLIQADGRAVGSELIGQDFTEDYFMKCRPSAVGYNTYTQEELDSGEYGGVASGSNNYAPSNPDLTERVQKDINAFLQENPNLKPEDIPTDFMTASGSGLDPHISPASAEIQLPKLAETTGLSMETLKEIVTANTKGKALGIFGEPTVNVLGVNLQIAQRMGLIHEID